MSILFAAVTGWFRTNPRNVWLIAGLVAVIAVLGFVYMKGRGDADRKNEAARAVEVQDALASDDKADQKSTAIATAHAERAAEAKQEVIDHVAKIPDSVPDDVAVGTACFELRNEPGVADLPACIRADQQRRAAAVR